MQEFLLKYTDTAQKYLTGSPWKRFINPQSDPPKNTDYHLCVKIIGVGKEGEEIAKNFMPIFENFPEMDAKFLTFTEEMEEYIKTYFEEKKRDKQFGPAGMGMFTPLERERDPILSLFKGGDLAIMFMPSTDEESVQKARFLAQTANIVGVMNMVVSDKISDNVLTDENADRPCEALVDYTSAYVFTDNESLTTKEAMTQIAKSILSICSEEGWHSEADKLTAFAQMQDMSISSEKKPIYSKIMRVHSEDAVADAANNALKELEEDIEIARVSDAFLHIETGSNTDSPSLTLQKEIETIRANFAEKVKMLSCISVDTTLGEDIRVNLIIRPPDAERLCGQAYWDDLLNKNKEDDVDDTDNPYKTVFQ